MNRVFKVFALWFSLLCDRFSDRCFCVLLLLLHLFVLFIDNFHWNFMQHLCLYRQILFPSRRLMLKVRIWPAIHLIKHFSSIKHRGKRKTLQFNSNKKHHFHAQCKRYNEICMRTKYAHHNEATGLEEQRSSVQERLAQKAWGFFNDLIIHNCQCVWKWSNLSCLASFSIEQCNRTETGQELWWVS